MVYRLEIKRDYWCTQITGTRHYQEDALGFNHKPNDLLMLLADGMGGYKGGDIASTVSIEAFSDSFDKTPNQEISLRLHHALRQAHDALAEVTRQSITLKHMGCTFVAVSFNTYNSRLNWISVGDSPLWLYRQQHLYRLNADHSKRAEIESLFHKGDISYETMLHHPERNVLRSALTGDAYPNFIDENSLSVNVGDIFILASDGILTLSTEEIKKIMMSTYKKTAKEISQKLIACIHDKNSPNQDNTSIFIFKVNSTLYFKRSNSLFNEVKG